MMERTANSEGHPINRVLYGSPTDLLSRIFIYAAVKDVVSIATTSSRWNAAINENGELWRCFCKTHYPELIRLFELCKESKLTNGDVGWKQLFRRRTMSPFKPSGINRQLQRDFDTVFRPEGIVAFSNCRNWEIGYYLAYEDDPTFQLRRQGIRFFNVHLNGMGYNSLRANGCSVHFRDLEYLLDHWDEECDIIRRWCAVLGLGQNEFTAKKPESENMTITVRFKRAVCLDEEYVSSGDEADWFAITDEFYDHREGFYEDEGDDWSATNEDVDDDGMEWGQDE